MKTSILLSLLLMSSLLSANDKLPKVRATKAEVQVVENTLNYPVLVKSKINAQIKSDADLIVLKQLVQLGQVVEKGQSLIELRHPDLTTNYRNRVMKAPLAGVIAGIHVQVGNTVSKGQLLVSINEPKNVYGAVEIPIADYTKLKMGLSAKLSFDHLDIKNLEGQVSGIGAMVDQKLGTVPLHLEISGEVLPGTIGLAEISLKKEELILVEEKILYFSGDDVFVPLLKKSQVKKVPVKLGKRIKNKVQIKSGLEPGQLYVSDSPKFLRSGQKVKVIPNESAETL